MTTRLLNAAKAVTIATVLLLAPAAVFASGNARPDGPRHLDWTPEFDPAAGGALVALLAGGALFITNRRKSK